MGAKTRRPPKGLTYHAWRAQQDTRILDVEGNCSFYLERPLTAGRLQSDWSYRLQLGNKASGLSGGITLLTIKRQDARFEGVSCQVINIYDAGGHVVTSLHWLGNVKKHHTGKSSGTKKYFFDWQGKELLWDSMTTFAGTDHFCTDIGSNDILCYFKTIFWPLQKDGKIEIHAKIQDETTRTILIASCMAYREWADKRETGVYVM